MIKLNNSINLFLSCCLFLLQISSSLAQNDGRIVGGVPTSIKEAPFLVQLRSKNFIFCSGTLISEWFVISAAHCFGKKPEQFTVVGGATNTYNDPGMAQSEVSNYIIPKMYDNKTYHMDIAVIKLKKPLVGDLIKPISMDCDAFKDNDEVKLFGWGKKHEDDKSIPVQLQTVKVKIVATSWCKWLYFNRRKITDLMFCAALEGKDSCNGDSGGPAIVNDQLCGVVSWGVGCAQANSPGVYTHLRQLSTFVKRAMKRLATP